MALIETTIDSVRVAVLSLERVAILKQKGADHYLPFWINESQGDIIAAQLQGEPYKDVELDLFLADINAAISDIKCATIHLENDTSSQNTAFPPWHSP